MTMIGLNHKVAELAWVGGIGVGLAASFLAAGVARGQATGEDAQARAIIDKAIQAHGGADKLSQFKAVSAKWAGRQTDFRSYFVTTVRRALVRSEAKRAGSASAEQTRSAKPSTSKKSASNPFCPSFIISITGAVADPSTTAPQLIASIMLQERTNGTVR